MSIEVSCFKIYVFLRVSVLISLTYHHHHRVSILNPIFKLLSSSFTIHHRCRVLLLDYLPWRVDVWSFALSMSAVKSGRAKSRLYVTSREELSSRVLLLGCLPWRVIVSSFAFRLPALERSSLFEFCLFRLLLLLLLLNCCCCWTNCCCWIAAAAADFGRFWNPKP